MHPSDAAPEAFDRVPLQDRPVSPSGRRIQASSTCRQTSHAPRPRCQPPSPARFEACAGTAAYSAPTTRYEHGAGQVQLRSQLVDQARLAIDLAKAKRLFDGRLVAGSPATSRKNQPDAGCDGVIGLEPGTPLLTRGELDTWRWIKGTQAGCHECIVA